MSRDSDLGLYVNVLTLLNCILYIYICLPYIPYCVDSMLNMFVECYAYTSLTCGLTSEYNAE